MRILVDIDGVVADTVGAVKKRWAELYPDIAMPDDQDLDGVTDKTDINEKVYAITHEEGFFYGLEPIEGAKEAIKEMFDMGIEVFFVTSAGVTYPSAASEKYRWVSEHYSQMMVASLVITPSKYVIKGDILIDDYPYQWKEDEASWEHYLFDTPHNQDDDTKPRLNWSNWKEVLGLNEA